MSNGLPIFISEYTSLDTVDNDKLYQELEQIDGIDLRYTILVVNKADTAALITFQDHQVLNQALPRKLSTKEFISYLSNGLGVKNQRSFQEPDYERVYQKVWLSLQTLQILIINSCILIIFFQLSRNWLRNCSLRRREIFSMPTVDCTV